MVYIQMAVLLSSKWYIGVCETTKYSTDKMVTAMIIDVHCLYPYWCSDDANVLRCMFVYFDKGILFWLWPSMHEECYIWAWTYMERSNNAWLVQCMYASHLLYSSICIEESNHDTTLCLIIPDMINTVLLYLCLSDKMVVGVLGILFKLVIHMHLLS